jgi:hypothetical protein
MFQFFLKTSKIERGSMKQLVFEEFMSTLAQLVQAEASGFAN